MTPPIDCYTHFYRAFHLPLSEDGAYFCSGKINFGSEWGPWVMRVNLHRNLRECELELSYFDWNDGDIDTLRVIRKVRAFPIDPTGTPFTVRFDPNCALWHQGLAFTIRVVVSDRVDGWFEAVRAKRSADALSGPTEA